VDLLVVGSGPAGVCCALQARRDGLDVLLVGDEPIGGLVRAARRIDNLAGTPRVAGRALAEAMSGQIAAAGVPRIDGRVAALRREDGTFVATTAGGMPVRARAVCLATGTRPRDWLADAGEGVVRDARAFAADLRGSSVVVVGGGEAALDTALSAADRGARVTVLVRGSDVRGAPGLRDEVRRAGIELRFGTEVDSVAGGPGSWTIRCAGGDEIGADVLAACVGRTARDDLFRELSGGSPPEPSVEQSLAPGLFAAGDVIRGRERYVATAIGDGQRAALAAAARIERER
jgi:thioredoxin reductase (NADPH)